MTTHSLTRRRVLQLSGASALGIAAAGLAAPAVLAQAKTKITVAYGQPSIQNLPLWVAKDKGFFDKYGLDASFVILNGANITQGLISGSVQFISSSAASTFLARFAGGDAIMVGTTVNKLPNDIIANNKVPTVAELKGKICATGGRGDILDAGVRAALKIKGLDPDKDVIFVQGLATDPQRLAAVANGSADFTQVNIDAREAYEKAGLHKLFSMLDLDLPFTLSGIFTTGAYLKSSPAVVEAYLKAMTEALQFSKKQQDGALAIAASYTKKTPAELAPAYAIYKEVYEGTPVVSAKLAKDNQQLLTSVNAKIVDANTNTFYDASVYDKLQRDGFFKSVGAA